MDITFLKNNSLINQFKMKTLYNNIYFLKLPSEFLFISIVIFCGGIIKIENTIKGNVMHRLQYDVENPRGVGKLKKVASRCVQ